MFQKQLYNEKKSLRHASCKWVEYLLFLKMLKIGKKLNISQSYLRLMCVIYYEQAKSKYDNQRRTKQFLLRKIINLI